MHVKEAAIATLKQYDIGNKFRLSGLPKASVLVPLFVKNGRLYTLMTLRSKEVKMPNAKSINNYINVLIELNFNLVCECV